MRRRFVSIFLWMAVAAGCAGLNHQPPPVTEIHPGILAGYLQPETLPDSLGLLPQPPAEGSAALALDLEVSRKSLALRDTPRWDLAAGDAVLKFPEAAATFSCALGIPITEESTPHLFMMLRRTLADAVLSTYTAKKNYQRMRPFMVNGMSTCAPEEESNLRKDGSYPSGHTAIGWAWALILAEIAPDRADNVFARGRAFGESRIVCNVHWHSDVVEGRFMGAAAVARLHADPLFRRDLEAAKAEYAAVRAQGLDAAHDCRAEAEALAYHWQNLTGEADILQSWQGDYPVAALDRLPRGRHSQAIGIIADADAFENVWNAFKPGQDRPAIDFGRHLVIFARNTQFYNRTAIIKVKVKSGVAEVMAMETLSALPIEEKVAMSMAVVAREGITAIQAGETIIPIRK